MYRPSEYVAFHLKDIFSHVLDLFYQEKVNAQSKPWFLTFRIMVVWAG